MPQPHIARRRGPDAYTDPQRESGPVRKVYPSKPKRKLTPAQKAERIRKAALRLEAGRRQQEEKEAKRRQKAAEETARREQVQAKRAADRERQIRDWNARWG